jgi:hypothetical protein
MKEIWKTPIEEKKEFTICNGTRLLKFVRKQDDGMYVYAKFIKDGNEFRQIGWEVVKPVKGKQPDGSTVFLYPCSEQFGKYGWDLPMDAL